ncbi:MAG: TldD/PmbA family protein [Acidobacteria bacterium]|nr:TldD/PmbA family protein [Acidobacteriota bacterium]
MEAIDLQLARETVQKALQAGATAADCILRTEEELNLTVRLGQVETLQQARSSGLGLRIFHHRRVAITSTSDLSWPSIERLIAETLDLARLMSEDPSAGLPDPAWIQGEPKDLQLWDSDGLSLPQEKKLDLVRTAEQAALDYDPRITNSEGASFSQVDRKTCLASSAGFEGEYRSSLFSLSATPVAGADGQLQRDFWFTESRRFQELDSPEEVGRIAAARALRRLGARRVKTQEVPVVFEPLPASSLLDEIFNAASGSAIYRKASFFTGKLGSRVAAPQVTVIDSGSRPGGLGSRPFDDEGILTRTTHIIVDGVLESYLCDSYAARKLDLHPTGNASRSLAAPPRVAANNLYLKPGPARPTEILASVSNGFYLTDLIGFGVNLVTGDYSRGASGHWIENGRLSHPVEEVTVAGNLNRMLVELVEIGNDLEFRTPIASPTLKIARMTVSGE